MKTQARTFTDSDFLFLKIKNLWTYFKSESLAFKSICAYIFVEMFRPQAIFPVFDFMPWAQLFLGMSILGLFSDAKSKFRFTGMHALIFLFAIMIHLSFLVAYNIDYSLKYYVTFIQWVVIFYLITTIVATKERFYVLFMIFFLGCLKIAVGVTKNWALRGFSFTSWGLKGPPGYFENSGELAILMLILFPIGFYLYKTFKNDVNKWEKLLLILAVVCPVLVVLGASSRGAQVALVAQFIAMFWRQIFKPKFLISITLFGALAWQVLPAEQKERFTTIGTDKTSIQRTLYWENGWEMMKEHPVLGVGYFNFSPYFETYYPEDVLYEFAGLPHNIFIQIGTDAGFLGLFVYFMILATAILKRQFIFKGRADMDDKPVDKLYSALWPAFKYGIIGFVVAGQFVTVGYYPFLWLSLALMYAMENAVINSKQMGTSNRA